MDAQSARGEFSSKQRSITNARGASSTGQAASGNATQFGSSLVTPQSGEVTLSTQEPVDLSQQQARAASELASQHEQSAQSLLRAASRSSWAALRAHAVEASASNAALLAELVPAALADSNRGVRFVACMAIAERPTPDLSIFIQPLLQDESASVRAAATLALARCGKKVDPSPIAAMVFANDPEVRANAYLVLGELGNPSAIPMIRDSLGKGLELINPLRVRLIDLAAAEALVKLGDQREVEPIRAALFAPPEQMELTVVACSAIGRLKDEPARPMLERLLSVDGQARRSPEIRLSAALALVELGGSTDAAFAVAREYMVNADGRVRALVASLLGRLRSPQAVEALAALVRDSDPTVQVAAAGGLDAAEFGEPNTP
jgi:HEAT repeat protein